MRVSELRHFDVSPPFQHDRQETLRPHPFPEGSPSNPSRPVMDNGNGQLLAEFVLDPQTHYGAAFDEPVSRSTKPLDSEAVPLRHPSLLYLADGKLCSKHPSSENQALTSWLGADKFNNEESSSWLDTINESGASSPSQAHSKASSMYMRRKDIHSLSYGTEAEFNAALDAAVEAAYDEGLEPESEVYNGTEGGHDRFLASRVNAELAKQFVRRSMSASGESDLGTRESLAAWGIRPAMKIASTVAGDGAPSFTEAKLEPYTPDSLTNLPPALSNSSPLLVSSSPTAKRKSNQSVRARRLSGQNQKELKIETNVRQDLVPTTSSPQRLSGDEIQATVSVSRERSRASSPLWATLGNLNIRTDLESPSKENSARASDIQGISRDPENPIRGESEALDKVCSLPSSWGNSLSKSSSSLKAGAPRSMSEATPESSYPETPSSSFSPHSHFNKNPAIGVIPVPPTPSVATTFSSGISVGTPFLLDSDIHSPNSPGCPNPMAVNAPVALEPCPESFLLRPFWLLRCLFQTMVHPRGGYLTTRLFVPRDAWCVRNVKIRAMEEKVSSCNLLTAALIKLGEVDIYDADAVLEEMQSFESVLDQVQTSLSKKLGSDVGLQGAMPLFKSGNTVEENGFAAAATATASATAADALSPKASSGSSKSYFSSWRKLRSKNSGFGTSAMPSLGNKDQLTISSLPMTPTPNSQFATRDVSQLHFDGPYANYMGALARLCDAAQVVGEYSSPPLFCDS